MQHITNMLIPSFIWVFPKIGVPPNHPFLIGFSIIFTIHFGVSTIFGNNQILHTAVLCFSNETVRFLASCYPLSLVVFWENPSESLVEVGY